MTTRLTISFFLAAFLSACSSAQLQKTELAIGLISGDIAAVAGKIDAGIQIAAADLPLACRITADVSAVADAIAASHAIGDKSRLRLSKAVNIASALVNSDLCLYPAMNPVAASLQIIRAIGAIKQAAATSSPITASALVSGNIMPPL